MDQKSFYITDERDKAETQKERDREDMLLKICRNKKNAVILCKLIMPLSLYYADTQVTTVTELMLRFWSERSNN